MKCMQCGHAMTHEAREHAVPGTAGNRAGWRRGERCPNCGEYEVANTAIDELNRALAQAVIKKPARFNDGEIRFLRSYLGLSGADFARA
jgi:hypothetical protein